jgi:serine/threonine-protein kinase
VRETIPDALEDVIKRALAKVPADRHQTAAQFAEALAAASTGRVSPVTGRTGVVAPRWHAWRTPVGVAAGAGLLVAATWLVFGRSGNGRPPAEGGGGLDPRRVAVLYFEDRTRDPALVHLADGLTEGLIDQLRQVQGLDVVSRNGVAPYQHKNVAADSVARELRVGTLVRGEVDREGDRVRVTVRLVDGASGADFNRQSFELPAADALGMRDSLAQQAALLFRQRLGDEVRLREQQAGTRSVSAWSLVQRAERTRKDAEAQLFADDVRGAFATFRRADTLLEQAERADPDWVEPIVLRGQIAYRWSRIVQGEPPEAAQWIATALGHAERALKLESGNAEGLELRGTLRYYHYLLGLARTEAAGAAELRSARQDLEAAVREKPGLASAYSTLSHLYFRTEDLPSGLLAARRAYEADAYLAVANEVVHRLFLGSYDSELHAQARQWCDVGFRRFPRDYRFTECQLWLMTTPAVEPDPEAAWRLLAGLDSLVPAPRRDFVHRHGMILLGAGLGRAGLKDSARHVLLRARADRRLDPGLDLVGLEAFARTVIGDRDEAITLLRQYLAANPEHLFQPSGDVHWWWRNLQGHPAFQDLVARRKSSGDGR